MNNFMKILLVEPDEYYHSQFMTHISDLGELVIASDFKTARELIPKINPDILITELWLSDEPGYKLLEEINGSTRPAMLIVIFSRIDHPEDTEAALNFGANGYFVKGKDTINDIRSLLLTYKHDRI